ncbi:3-isopropylmalate dehydratase small subunit [Rubinisphaera margarita]|uniref:3-isopropylmalate dehydratase small subunit n=1 Tax=Rubinisphaera margarita TaxID=2909586 RepID=UPI001EE99B3F|nr:3-isopropylmalate dehydratase small subunit [Rubinisphaera margarita]MCG6157279.1 3-isopropylmalate dehydratase small subunit [Rubinisphaera margarita]
MNEIKQVKGTGVPLLLDDIDTDRIIPARFLRCVTFDGLGEHAFEDDREQDPKHPFNNARYQSGSVLVAGRNFGCGSSREHAPQSLMRWGINAIIAQSFAEIFFGNCTALGVPTVTASAEATEKLCKMIEADPQLEIEVDLEKMQVTAGDFSCPVETVASSRDALLSGQWDFLSLLLENKPAIQQTADSLPYMKQFA